MRKSEPSQQEFHQRNRKRTQTSHNDQPPLHRGKWTSEEETYVARVIRDFHKGYLHQTPAGTTLRAYLSERLQCDPMRITKKFTGDSCIGKKIFHPAIRCADNQDEIDKARAELSILEKRWKKRLDLQQRDLSKKLRRHHAMDILDFSAKASATINLCQQNNQVVRIAAWLCRADRIISPPQSQKPPFETTSSSTYNSVQEEMKVILKLIEEGPMIQQNFLKALPCLLQQKPKGSAVVSPLLSSTSSTSSGVTKMQCIESDMHSTKHGDNTPIITRRMNVSADFHSDYAGEPGNIFGSKCQSDQDDIATKTATWLDRANAILSNCQSNIDKKLADVEFQIKEVVKLIDEGVSLTGFNETHEKENV